MKKNVAMIAMIIILLLQLFGLFPGLTNRDLADWIYSAATGEQPIHSEEILNGE